MNAPLAIVSGITGGIGRTVAQRLWCAGYAILGIGTNIIQLDEAYAWFTQHPRDGQGKWLVRQDLGKRESIRRIQNLCCAYKEGVALVAICHGCRTGRGCAEGEGMVEMAEEVIGVDVLGAYRICQAAYPGLCVSGNGTIVMVSSIHAHATFPERVPYAIAKSAMGGLMRGLAVEWGKDNITVNMLTPWQVEGEKTAYVAAGEGEDTLQRYVEHAPLGRLVSPEDIATTILWLAKCRSITGSEIPLDCGVRASAWHRPFLYGKGNNVSP